MKKYNLIYIPGEAFANGRIPTKEDYRVVGTFNTVEEAMEAQKRRDWEGSPGMVFVKEIKLA